MNFTSQLGYYVHMQEESTLVKKINIVSSRCQGFLGAVNLRKENTLSSISPFIYFCGGVLGLAGMELIFFIAS